MNNNDKCFMSILCAADNLGGGVIKQAATGSLHIGPMSWDDRTQNVSYIGHKLYPPPP